MDGKGDVAAWVAKADLWATYSESGGSKGAYEAAAGGGGLDVRIVLARPFIEHLMHNVIMTRLGARHGRHALRPGGHAALGDFRPHSSASIPEVAANRLLLVSFAGQHAGQDHRGPLHGPLQGRRHQAAERACHARRRVRGLRRGLQHALLARDTGGKHDRGRPAQDNLRSASRSPTTTDRYALDARLPVLGGASSRQRPARHGHVRDHRLLPWEVTATRGATRPSRAARRCPAYKGSSALAGALRRGHEGGREPGLHLAGHRPTTPRASWARTASTTPSPRAS